MTLTARWALSLIILALIPIQWWMTVTPWEAEIAGIYSFSRAVLNLAGLVVGMSAIYVLLGRESLREKVLSLALGFASVAFFLFVVEAAGAVLGIDYQKVFRATSGDTALALSDGVNKPDPVLINIHWPHSSFSGEVSGNLVQMGIPTETRYATDVHYDRNGFRNHREYEMVDIAVIGDSFVEAATIVREKALAALLESRLGVATVNLGQINYGLRQELEVLKRFALPLAPKLIVWVVFGGNDLRDVKAYEQNLSEFNEPSPPVPLVETLFLRNALVAGGALIKSAFRVVFHWHSEKALNRSGLYTRADNTTERVYFGQTADPWSPHDWQVAADTLTDAAHLARESGAEFVVVYVPRKYRVYHRHITVSPEREIARWAINDLPEELGHWAADHGIRFIDTSPLLEDLVAKGRHPYFVDDVHWNDLGHETAAAAIVDYLSQERVFPFQPGKS